MIKSSVRKPSPRIDDYRLWWKVPGNTVGASWLSSRPLQYPCKISASFKNGPYSNSSGTTAVQRLASVLPEQQAQPAVFEAAKHLKRIYLTRSSAVTNPYDG